MILVSSGHVESTGDDHITYYWYWWSNNDEYSYCCIQIHTAVLSFSCPRSLLSVLQLNYSTPVGTTSAFRCLQHTVLLVFAP